MPTRLGEFELLILLTLTTAASHDAPHGAALRAAMTGRTGRTVLPGALYNALDRLERRGLVTSWLGEPTPQRGGKRKRHYRLEPAGLRALEEARAALQVLVSHPVPGGDR